MTAPSTPSLTPSLGPQGSRSQRGSVTGGPWQLVEVPSKATSGALSNPGTPLITVARSPAVQPTAGVVDDLEEWKLDDHPDEPQDTGKARWGDDEMAAETGKGGYEDDDDDEDFGLLEYFIGDWTDNLGHQVIVSVNETGGGRQRDRRRRKGRGKGSDRWRHAFVAQFLKFGIPDKRFNIAKDRVKKRWTCGNGVLVREDTTSEKIVWKTADGRVSSWTRTPPEGPIYFDPPPAPNQNEEQGEYPPWHQHVDWSRQDYYYPEGVGGGPMSEWKELNLQGNEEDSQTQTGNSQMIGTSPATEDKPATAWNLSAVEFVPAAKSDPAPIVTPAPSTPSLAPSTPSMAPVAPASVSFPPSCQLQLTEESETADVQIAGNRLVWQIPDKWGKLLKFPKDFCLTSPMFGVRQATNMQLVFYPNGSRTAEAGRCTVALTRGPGSAGIKFEFSVNDRGSGPKVCLGRRYLGDYPKPYDDSEESKGESVTVSMTVLDVLGVDKA